MKKVSLLLIILLLPILCSARTITVDCNGLSDFNDIQAAIDDANDGDTVIVAEGIYTGDSNRDINFLGKAITVRSTDPNDPNIVAATIIDCNGTEANPHRGFTFNHGEEPNSVLAGLTITNGYGPSDIYFAGNNYSCGGAILCDDCSPTISHCNITGNSAGDVGGGVCCWGWDSKTMITNCTIAGNSAGAGGGVGYEFSYPTISHCTIADNSSHGYGGGGILCLTYDPGGIPGLISNCTIKGNSAVGYGGGVFCDWKTDIIISNCMISGNSAGDGGGICCYDFAINAMFKNCTITGNSAAQGGGICYIGNSVYSTITNCILWDDRDTDGFVNEIEVMCSPFPPPGCHVTSSYCLIDEDPCFAVPGYWDANGTPTDASDDFWIDGDYHLLLVSPCVDAGDPNYSPTPGETDIDGQIRIYNGCVDMGADEAIPSDPSFYPLPRDLDFYAYAGGFNPESQILSIRNIGTGTLNWEIEEDCNWLTAEPNNGQSSGEVDEVTLSVDISGLSVGSYSCAIMVTSDNATNSPQTISVDLHLSAGGILRVPSAFGDIQSGIEAAGPGDTIIVEQGTYRGDGNRDLDFLGKQITVRSTDPNDPNIVANTVIDCNGTSSDPHRGFYFHRSEGPDTVVAGFTIINGYGPDKLGYDPPSTGGAMLLEGSSPTITRCVLKDTYAWRGGAIYCQNSSTIISNCTIIMNSAGGYGGAVYCKNSSNVTINNCKIISNSAANHGGGIYFWESTDTTVSNCTIIDNPNQGVHYHYSSGVIINCILWNNTIYARVSDLMVSYSDIEGGQAAVALQSSTLEWGPGNINDDPCFADSDTNDYHLQSQAGRWDVNSQNWVIDANTSPCIDAGNSGCPLGDEPNDANNVRINMGAYGGTAEASKTPADWRRIADLTNDWAVDFNDLKVFVNYWLETGQCIPSDLNRSQSVDFADFSLMALHWLEDNDP